MVLIRTIITNIKPRVKTTFAFPLPVNLTIEEWQVFSHDWMDDLRGMLLD